MKKILLLIFIISSVSRVSAFNHQDSIPPHLLNIPFPDFKILLTDSITHFYTENLSNKKNTIIMSFSPECDHCRHQTEEILKHIDKFRGTQIVMATSLPFEKMKQFYDEMNIAKYKNIIMGRDELFFFSRYFRNQFLPGIAVYNKKRTLLNYYDGGVKTEELIKLLDE